MSALTKGRNTVTKDGVLFVRDVAAATTLFAGGIACLDASGNATPGATATTLTADGRIENSVDNASGAAGDLTVKIRKGVFRFENSSAGDAITKAEIGDDYYIVDDQTVAKTDGTATRSVAGKIVDVDSVGVWVQFT